MFFTKKKYFFAKDDYQIYAMLSSQAKICLTKGTPASCRQTSPEVTQRAFDRRAI